MSTPCHVITGATGGIGSVVAKRLIDAGENVVLVSRSEEKLAELFGGIPGVITVAADLSLSGAVQTVAKAVKEDFGSVKGFVHCAGSNTLAPLSMIDEVRAQELYMLHAVFPMKFMGWMGKACNHETGASCVLVSSASCHSGAAGNAAYASAKGAVEGMLKSAAAELAPRGVRVNAVVPGFVKTEMAMKTFESLGKTADQIAEIEKSYPLGFSTPENIADAIEFFLSQKSANITGQTLVIDGGRSLA